MKSRGRFKMTNVSASIMAIIVSSLSYILFRFVYAGWTDRELLCAIGATIVGLIVYSREATPND